MKHREIALPFEIVRRLRKQTLKETLSRHVVLHGRGRIAARDLGIAQDQMMDRAVALGLRVTLSCLSETRTA
jgi:hypothetical protein